jgi:hypothetical protein
MKKYLDGKVLKFTQIVGDDKVFCQGIHFISMFNNQIEKIEIYNTNSSLYYYINAICITI